jgi:hypothetical protein
MTVDKSGKVLLTAATEKLAARYDKWPRCEGNYVEKCWDKSTLKCELLSLEVRLRN